MIQFIVAAFACFRLTELLVIDDGPFDIFLKLRTWAGVYDLGLDDKPKDPLGRMLECGYCTGMYLALPLAVWIDQSLSFVVWWFAIAGAQSILQSLVRRPT